VKRIAIVPTLATLGNGLCGFGAITCAAKVTPQTDPQLAVWLLCWAGWLILLAILFDVLDGRLARMAKQTSDFGGELDSLCDAVSFGVAPAVLIMKLCPGFPPKTLWMMAGLFVVCALLRLARFNVANVHDESAHMEFSGLPTPAAAGCVAALPIMRAELVGSDLETSAVWAIATLLPFATLLLAVLMASRVSYPHVVNQTLSGRRPYSHLIKVVFAGVAIALIRELALAIVFWGYVSWGVLGAAFRAVRPARHRASDPVPATSPAPDPTVHDEE